MQPMLMPQKKISLSRKSVTLKVGKKYKLRVKNTKKKIKWKSKNKRIATVSSKGVVKARKVGKTKVYARVSGKKFYCKIVVKRVKKVSGTTQKTPLPTEAPTVAPTVAPIVVPTEAPTVAPTIVPTAVPTVTPTVTPSAESDYYTFRSASYLTEHYEKHGVEMGYASEQAYLDGANALINNPAALHKLEAEDDDHIYYLQATNEIVFLSQDGYIRTYFICSGKDYFDRQ